MINSREDYIEYLIADRKALNKEYSHWYEKYTDPIWRFERLLRKTEYFNNVHNGAVGKIVSKLYLLRLRCTGYKLGFSIPINVFGKGLSIAHIGTIVVSDRAKVGSFCRLHTSTNIGLSYSDVAPTIGDNAYIAPGAKIFGPISIGDNVAIAANAVVNKTFSESNVCLGGVPAKIINYKGSTDIWKH